MKNVWIITAAVALYGIANGLLLNATPQISLELKFSSGELGLIGAGLPIGYATSCLLFGRLFARMTGKYVMLAGVLGAATSMLATAQAKTSTACVIAQIGFGLSSGAFWPFASAWLLDFHSPEISKTRLLRHYNVAWTSGTALGMFAGGIICDHGFIREAVYTGVALMFVTFISACRAKATAHDHFEPALRSGIAPAPLQVGLALVIAAVIANLVALGTRSMLLNNYAELNERQGFGADRMGFISAISLVSQLIAFGTGSFYEPWLGLRRIYVLFAVSLIGINVAFAYSTNMAILFPAVLLHGLVLAMSFQTGMLAAIGYFSSPRTGTTFHEAVIGIGGICPLLAGMLVSRMKSQGVETIEALRTPFLYMTALVAFGLLVQMIFISFRPEHRALLRPKTEAPPAPKHSLAS